MVTSTAILLLQERVDLLTNSFDWIIGGITITIAVLIGLFALVQFIFQNRLNNKKLAEMEKKMNSYSKSIIDSEKAQLQKDIQEQIQKSEKALVQRMKSLNADVQRSYANYASDKNLPHISFHWWVSAGANYAEIGEDILTNTALDNMRSELKKVTDKVGVDFLWEKLEDINNELDRLKIMRPETVEIIRLQIKEKLNAHPKGPPGVD